LIWNEKKRLAKLRKRAKRTLERADIDKKTEIKEKDREEEKRKAG